ncbi:MAG TPA: hypothetical protein VD906_02675 [Caulobacteraceae bacterium]|nr:hypothetical protein [Caulobacteraceae bacterium]
MKSAAIVALAASVMLSACVSTKNVPLDSGRLASMNSQAIAFTDRAAPDFSATKSSGVVAGSLFGVVGAVAAATVAINAGNELVKNNQIEDPSDAIAKSLTEALAASSSARIVAAKATVGGEEIEEIIATVPDAQYIVDVRTTSWGTLYYPTDWAHYGILYGAQFRLIDAASKEVVAQSFCFVKPEKEKGVDSPTYNELTENGAAKLKAMLSAAGEKCTNQFRAETLKL